MTSQDLSTGARARRRAKRSATSKRRYYLYVVRSMGSSLQGRDAIWNQPRVCRTLLGALWMTAILWGIGTHVVLTRQEPQQ